MQQALNCRLPKHRIFATCNATKWCDATFCKVARQVAVLRVTCQSQLAMSQSEDVFCSQEISRWQFPTGALQRVTPPLQLRVFFSRHRWVASCKENRLVQHGHKKLEPVSNVRSLNSCYYSLLKRMPIFDAKIPFWWRSPSEIRAASLIGYCMILDFPAWWPIRDTTRTSLQLRHHYVIWVEFLAEEYRVQKEGSSTIFLGVVVISEFHEKF